MYDTVLEKVQKKHPDEYGQIDKVYKTLESEATHIHLSKTNDSSLLFLNTNVRSKAGDPLRVPVKVYDDGTGIMTSAYYTASTDQGALVWSRDGGPVIPTFKGRRRGP